MIFIKSKVVKEMINNIPEHIKRNIKTHAEKLTMKTNVSIKFNSIEEYREIESKLIEMGYENDKNWNEMEIIYISKKNISYDNYISIGGPYPLFTILNHIATSSKKTYNSLQEFLND